MAWDGEEGGPFAAAAAATTTTTAATQLLPPNQQHQSTEGKAPWKILENVWSNLQCLELLVGWQEQQMACKN